MTTAQLINYGIVALGALSIYLLLPKTGRNTRAAGAVLGCLTLAGIVGSIMAQAATSPGGSFYLFGCMAVVFAVGVIVQQRPVYSALYLVLVVLCVACLSLRLAAEFLAVAMVIIYGGAILVTYMFVIMLAQQGGQAIYDRWARAPVAACFAGFLLVAALTSAVTGFDPAPELASALRADALTVAPLDPIQSAGIVLMTRNVVVLEVAGVLLLLAMVGAIAIARKRFPVEGQRTIELGEAGRRAGPY